MSDLEMLAKQCSQIDIEIRKSPFCEELYKEKLRVLYSMQHTIELQLKLTGNNVVLKTTAGCSDCMRCDRPAVRVWEG